MKRMVKVNGHMLNVETAGSADAPVVILLHHGLGSIRSWKGQFAAFSAAGYQVIAYDRWGHGRSAHRQHWSMPDFEPDLADLDALLRELDQQQVSLIGHSDGGNIALLYALAHPEQVRSLVVIAAHIYVEPKMISGIQTVKDKFDHDSRFRSGMVRVHGENADQVFWGWFNGWMNPAIRDWDLRSELNQISSPTLVVQGTEDEHTEPQHARDLAGTIPGAELWLVPGANHMLPQEMPDKFNQRALQFQEVILTMSANDG